MQNQKPEKNWINPDELEAMFGIAKDTQQRYRTNKKIPYSKIGGFIFYNIHKIDKWIEAHAFDVQNF